MLANVEIHALHNARCASASGCAALRDRGCRDGGTWPSRKPEQGWGRVGIRLPGGWKRRWPPALPSLFLVTKAPTICTVACGARVIAVKQDVGPMLLRLIEV